MRRQKARDSKVKIQTRSSAIYHTEIDRPGNNRSPTASSYDYHNYQGSPTHREEAGIRYSDTPSSAAIKALMREGFTYGLALMLLKSSTEAFALRIWVVDNSGSMSTEDGHKVVPVQSDDYANVEEYKAFRCSRWEEICDSVRYHAKLAARSKSPTIFRLLNDPGEDVGPMQFSVAQEGSEYIEEDLQIVENIMNRARPAGVTPLSRHLLEISEGLAPMIDDLKRKGQKVCVVLATDGLPTDEEGYGGPSITNEFMAALHSLEGLPIWLVIKLCTDEPQVCEFFNELDGKLEISLEVLDDYMHEAEEVSKHNDWLTYAYPLHRLRESGFHDRVFDMLDERPLTHGELNNFCLVLFGLDYLPDPALEWVSFLKAIDKQQKSEARVWNPVKQKMSKWLDLKKLHADYGDGSRCTIM